MRPKISVIICSWQAPPSLDDTLTCLIKQGEAARFEVLVVNNGFDAVREQQLRSTYANVIFVNEPTPGLGFARRTGFRSAAGDWFVLFDDDNTAKPDFLAILLQIVESFPNLGGITPLVEPVWERRPPRWLEEFGALFLSYNSTSTFSRLAAEAHFSSERFREAERPPGGGMVIHRSVASAYLNAVTDRRRAGLERTGTSLMGCQDHDIWGFIERLGMDILITDKLRVYHHIPAGRLRMSYLLRLNYQMMYSYGILDQLTRSRERVAAVPAIFQAVVLSCKLIKIGLTCPSANPLQKQMLLVARQWGRLAGDLRTLPLASAAQ